MRTRFAPLLIALLGLAGCGGSSPPTATPSGTTASQEAVSRIGDVTVRANAIQTSTLTPAIASRRPSRSNRMTCQPSSAAIRASSASGLTATGLPTARSMGRSEAESE